MGLFKKSDKSDADDGESNRRALFGRSKNKSPQDNPNPYAQPIPTDPYTKAKQSIGMAPPPPGGLGPNGPSPALSPGQSPGSGPHNIPSDNKYGGGYTPNSYGNQGGYGGNRYGSGSNSNGGGTPSRYGAGGYGGLGSADPNDASGETDRNALFGGAKNRQQPGSGGGAPPPYSPDQQGGQPGYGGGSNEYSMAKFEERQLTAEEQEEESIQATKQEMRHVKQGDISSTRNALRVAAQAEETGRQTLARLGAQGEMVHDAEGSLDAAKLEGHLAEDKARELKQLNEFFMKPHMNNPFTKNARERARDEKILERNRERRGELSGTRAEAYKANAQLERDFRDLDRQSGNGGKGKKSNVTERAKYQFEADSEDEAMEDEIEQNLGLLSGAAGRLNGLAKATGRELDEQNRHLERITGKSDYVDDQIAMNRAKLDRIR